MFGHNSFDSPRPLVFGTSPPAPREIFGDTPEFFEFCDKTHDLTTAGWKITGKDNHRHHAPGQTGILGSYWKPKGWKIYLYTADGNMVQNMTNKRGSEAKVCVSADKAIRGFGVNYVGVCEDSNRKSLKDEVVEEDIRDDEGVCGDCVDGYEENADGKCVEKQDETENERHPAFEDIDTLWGVTILGGAVLAVILIGSMMM